MPTNEELKSYLDGLTPEQQKESIDYLSLKGTAAKQSAEKLKLLQSLPTPIADSDRAFIEKHKNNKDIQRDKIKFTETTIELDWLKFPRTIVKYEDIKNIAWLQLDANVYQRGNDDYFTFDAVKQLGKAWYKVPSKDQREQAVGVFGWSYGLLKQFLNYPKVGTYLNTKRHRRGGVDSCSYLWSSTPRNDTSSYGVWFGVDERGNDSGDLNYCYHNYGRSLVFLED